MCEHYQCGGCSCHICAPCTHCTDGHDLSLQERVANVHIRWENQFPGNHIVVDGIEFLVMTGQDYCAENGIKECLWRPHHVLPNGQGALYAIPLELVDEEAYQNIVNRHLAQKFPLPKVKTLGDWRKEKVAERDRKPAHSTYTFPKGEVPPPFIRSINEHDTIVLQNLRWKVVRGEFLQDFNPEPFRALCGDRDLWLVPQHIYDETEGGTRISRDTQKQRNHAQNYGMCPKKFIKTVHPISGHTADFIILDDPCILNDDHVDALKPDTLSWFTDPKPLETRPCTCHPDDVSHLPGCARKFAASECLATDPSLIRPKAEHWKDVVPPDCKPTTHLTGPLIERKAAEDSAHFGRVFRKLESDKRVHHAAQLIRPSRHLREDCRLGAPRYDLEPSSE